MGDPQGRQRPARRRSLPGRRVELGPNPEPEHLFRELIAAYLAGSSRITIHQQGGVRIPTRAVVESFRSRIDGPVAIGEEDADLVLFNLDPNEHRSIATVTFRQGQHALDLLREAGQEPKEPISEAEWAARDDVVDRLAWEVHRLVTMRRQQGRPHPGVAEGRLDPVGWLEASRSLERIGDHAVLIGVHLATWRATRPGEAERRLLDEYYRQACDYVSSALVLLGDPRPGSANAALDLGEALRVTAQTLLDRLLAARVSASPPPPNAIVALGWVLHSLERVVAYGEDLVEIALDHARGPWQDGEGESVSAIPSGAELSRGRARTSVGVRDSRAASRTGTATACPAIPLPDRADPLSVAHDPSLSALKRDVGGTEHHE